MTGIKKKQVVTIYIKTNTHDRIQCKRIIHTLRVKLQLTFEDRCFTLF